MKGYRTPAAFYGVSGKRSESDRFGFKRTNWAREVDRFDMNVRLGHISGFSDG
jgi:hypothetical protein